MMLSHSLAHRAAQVCVHRRYLWLFASILVLLLMLIASMVIGAKYIAPEIIWRALLGDQLGLSSTIVWDGRLPRTLNGVLIGMALGVAGALIQAVTRNPLADPGILGVNVGASLAMAIAVVFLGASTFPEFFIYAAIGALLTSVLVFVIGRSTAGRPDPLKLTLAGVAIGAVLGGLSTGLTLFNPSAFEVIRFWVVGTLDSRNLDVPLFIAPIILIGCTVALALTPSLNTLGLGEALSASLGASLVKTQLISLLVITLLCGAATAAAGPIGFISLMMPHIARWMVGPDQRWIVPFCAVLTPSLLLFSDIIGRVIAPGELRVSVVTAFIGAPILIYLVRQKRASSL